MKSTKILPLFLTIFVSIGCSSDKEYNYGIEYMHGDVKSVDLSVFEAKAKFGEALEGEWLGSLSYSFNTNNQIEQLNIYDDIDDELKGTPFDVLKFKYDSNNNLLTINFYDSEGGLRGVHECQYSSGRIKKCDKHEYYKVYDGSIKEECRTDIFSFSNTQMTVKINNYYDKFIFDIKYDNKGKILQATYTDVGTGKRKTTLVERDNDGNLLKSTNTYDDMFIFDFVHPYFIYTFGPASVVFSGDSNFNQAENAYLYEYEFDEHKNWTKRIVYENDKEHPQYIYKRSIEYYD